MDLMLQVHIDRREALIRFGLMHTIATNMSVWLRTLINEIMNEYHHQEQTYLIDQQATTESNSTSEGKFKHRLTYGSAEQHICSVAELETSW